ncbi:DUF421 domain-containing protein, partial [Salmonella enterica subsp. enterica serovar Poona]
MKAFDLQRMALDNVPVAFLGEVALRSFYTCLRVLVLIMLTASGAVRQISLIE